MRAFLDTNVVVDFFGHRDPFFSDAADIIDMAVRDEITLVVSSLTFINAAYVLRKSFGKDIMLRKLTQLASICDISYIDSNIIKDSILRNSRDFEDCVQYLSAIQGKADLIITRDKTGFADLGGITMKPAEFLENCRK